MFTKTDVITFHVNTEGASSGTKNFDANSCEFCDLRELFKMCKNPSKEVIIALHPTNSTTTMRCEKFYMTGEMSVGEYDPDENGIFIFACYSRSGSNVINRKMVMHFVDMAHEDQARVEVDYYSS